ncbi:hypothetical protein TNCT_84231 [Trichonephila clavata]|uniref:Uncharacterized protein n=1 Tax=Trichonephila clavata TaxID=2740835 RepID=A0A8X6J776_TRICU|nr:hypothetical protein TNCT_84231 [Trichonephila clavata]
MPIIVPCNEKQIEFEEETGIVQEARIVHEAEIFQEEDSLNLPETSQITPTNVSLISKLKTNTKLKKERERTRKELIDAALMKIGGSTDSEDLLLEQNSKSIKKYPAEAKNEALESMANYVFQMNKKCLQ